MNKLLGSVGSGVSGVGVTGPAHQAFQLGWLVVTWGARTVERTRGSSSQIRSGRGRELRSVLACIATVEVRLIGHFLVNRSPIDSLTATRLNPPSAAVAECHKDSLRRPIPPGAG